MPRRRSLTFLIAAAVLVLGCGGSDSSNPLTTGNNSNSGSGRTMKATYNGVDFNPTLMTSAYLNGQVSVNANDGTRTLAINAINVPVAGVYSVAPGNPNSALAQWIDGNGSYSSGLAGGAGTITFTVLQLGRVAGSFSMIVKNAGGASTVSLVGTFDIKFP